MDVEARRKDLTDRLEMEGYNVISVREDADTLEFRFSEGVVESLLKLLEARCSTCENGPKCFFDREPICSHYGPSGVE